MMMMIYLLALVLVLVITHVVFNMIKAPKIINVELDTSPRTYKRPGPKAGEWIEDKITINPCSPKNNWFITALKKENVFGRPRKKIYYCEIIHNFRIGYKISTIFDSEGNKENSTYYSNFINAVLKHIENQKIDEKKETAKIKQKTTSENITKDDFSLDYNKL